MDPHNLNPKDPTNSDPKFGEEEIEALEAGIKFYKFAHKHKNLSREQIVRCFGPNLQLKADILLETLTSEINL